MSRNNTNTKRQIKTQTQTLVPYCKVCQDAGKPENVFRSHFTRETKDPNAKVICPTLLALECRYCFKNGHTVKYCPSLKNKEKQTQNPNPKPIHVNKPAATNKPIAPALTNTFHCLDCDSDSDNEEQEVQQEQFPQLCAPAKAPQTTFNYAVALAKPAPAPASAPAPVPELKTILAPWTDVADKPPAKVPSVRSVMTSWADDSDSDEEDIIPCPQLYRREVNEDW
jgi:hypothetical protein